MFGGVFILGCQVMKHPDVGATLDDILNEPADVVMTLFLNSWVFCFLALLPEFFRSLKMLLKTKDLLQCRVPPHLCHGPFDLWHSDCGLAAYW